MIPPTVRIHYLRPPGREEIFRQRLVFEDADVKVTHARDVVLRAPLTIDGSVVLETGSDVVWFTFPGVWHDIGRFHRSDGVFTGIYANVLTPPTFEPGDVWRTTDLFLDVWIPEVGEPQVLDRDELQHAVVEGWVDEATALRATQEAEHILAEAAGGRWPPPVVDAWTLERARAASLLE